MLRLLHWKGRNTHFSVSINSCLKKPHNHVSGFKKSPQMSQSFACAKMSFFCLGTWVTTWQSRKFSAGTVAFPSHCSHEAPAGLSQAVETPGGSLNVDLPTPARWLAFHYPRTWPPSHFPCKEQVCIWLVGLHVLQSLHGFVAICAFFDYLPLAEMSCCWADCTHPLPSTWPSADTGCWWDLSFKATAPCALWQGKEARMPRSCTCGGAPFPFHICVPHFQRAPFLGLPSRAPSV